MIDMHCHILPGVDDGSKSMEESIEMVKESKLAGFSGTFVTPHYFGEQSLNRENTLFKIEELRYEIRKQNIEFTIYEGNEVYLCDDIYNIIEKQTVCSLNNTKYVLVELPRKNKVLDLNNILFKLSASGYTLIIAHPERYEFVQENPNSLLSIAELGVHFQINYLSLLGYYGKESEKTAKILLDNDFVSFIGSDAHRSGFAYNEVNKIKDIMKKYVSNDRLNAIVERNPVSVARGEYIDNICPNHYSKKIMDFLKY